MSKKRLITITMFFIVPFLLFSQTVSFGFNHRVGDPVAPSIVIRRAAGGDAISQSETGYSTAFSSDGSSFKDVAVIGVQWVGSYTLSTVKLTISSFVSVGGNECSYVLRFIDPHTGDERTKLINDVTQPDTVTVLTNYRLYETHNSDDLVLLSMKADTDSLPLDSGVDSTVYTITIRIEVAT